MIFLLSIVMLTRVKRLCPLFIGLQFQIVLCCELSRVSWFLKNLQMNVPFYSLKLLRADFTNLSLFILHKSWQSKIAYMYDCCQEE